MAAKEYVCTKCGYTGKPKKKMKGSFAVELMLIILAIGVPILIYSLVLNRENPNSGVICCGIGFIFVIPELIYGIWRQTSKYNACPSCGLADTMIPVDSPAIQQQQKQQQQETEATKECPYCAETIKAKAKVCRFCGADLSEDKNTEEIEDQNKEE